MKLVIFIISSNNGYMIYMDILTITSVVNLFAKLDLIYMPVSGNGVKGWVRGIVILASCKRHFIRVHENLVQYSCNDISIRVTYSQKLWGKT